MVEGGAIHVSDGAAMAVGRPVTRVERVGEGTYRGMREVFGTSTAAYRGLRLEGLVAYATFYRAWRGLPVSDAMIRAIDTSWGSFIRRLIERYGV